MELLSELRYKNGATMIFIILFLIAIGAWEIYVFLSHYFPEDLFLTVACFGAAAFLLAMKLDGVVFLP